MNDFHAIENHYRTELPVMMAEYEQTGCMDFDPYAIDHLIHHSPIEDQAWIAIRSYGLPFYPQVPVQGFFPDFANPFLKIIIECDGAQWHDKKKDAIRDEWLDYCGWTVYRITGRECNKVMDEPGEMFMQMRADGKDISDDFKY